MVLNVAAAFIQQVIVDCAFFVDGHEFLQYTLGEFETLGRNLNYRPAFNFENVVYCVAVGLIGAVSDLDLCEQTILLLIAPANSLQGASNAIRKYWVA